MSVSLRIELLWSRLNGLGTSPLSGPLALALLLAQPAIGDGGDGYVPYSGIRTGTLGLTPLTLEINNRTDAPIVCDIQLAHWYAENLGLAAVGGSIAAELWHDSEDGTIALLNASGDQMPVEAVWCAPAGTPTERRTRVGLPIAAGPLSEPAILRRICRGGPNRGLVCEAE